MPSSNLRVKKGIYQGIDSICVVGPFDSMDEQVDILADSIIGQGKKDIVFDFIDTVYMTSSGIAAIIKVLRKTQRIKGRLFIANITQDMYNLIVNSNLDRYLQVI